MARTQAVIPTGSITSTQIASNVIQIADVAITRANILAMYTTPVLVVAAPGAGFAIQFISMVLITDFAGAAYTDGGNVVLNYNSAQGDNAVSVAISAANSFGAASDQIFSTVAEYDAGGEVMVANTGLYISNTTAAFTDPGTATGVGRLKIAYRVITTGL